MKSVILFVCLQWFSLVFVFAGDTRKSVLEDESPRVIEKIEVCCTPAIVERVVAVTPELERTDPLFRLEWDHTTSKHSMIVDFFAFISSGRLAKQRPFDCRWYISLTDADRKYDVYISGGEDVGIIDGKFYSLDRKKTRKLLGHFDFLRTLLLD